MPILTTLGLAAALASTPTLRGPRRHYRSGIQPLPGGPAGHRRDPGHQR